MIFPNTTTKNILPNPTEQHPTEPWFKIIPVGKNWLIQYTMLKEMCTEAGITANYSNCSLRAYGATAMFQGWCF